VLWSKALCTGDRAGVLHAFRVSGLGIDGSGFRVYVLWVGVQGSGFRVQSSGFGGQG